METDEERYERLVKRDFVTLLNEQYQHNKLVLWCVANQHAESIADARRLAREVVLSTTCRHDVSAMRDNLMKIELGPEHDQLFDAVYNLESAFSSIF